MTSTGSLSVLHGNDIKNPVGQSTYTNHVMDRLFFAIAIVFSYSVSLLLKRAIFGMYLGDNDFNNVENQGWVANESKIFESLFVVPTALFSTYSAVADIDVHTLKGDMSQVSSGVILLTRSWSIFLFLVFGLVITYAEESLISTPIFVFCLLTSFCGYFILEPYMISCFHVLSTLGWSGLIDLSLRTHSLYELTAYPYQCLLACLLVVTTYLRGLLFNQDHLSKSSYQYIGIPIMMLMYWCLEIPSCEVLSVFYKEAALCGSARSFQRVADTGYDNIFFLILVILCIHIAFGKVTSFVCTGCMFSIDPSDHSSCVTTTSSAADRKQKRANHSANRLERGRADSREKERRRGSKGSGREKTDSISSVSSTDSQSSTSSLLSVSLQAASWESGTKTVGGSQRKKIPRKQKTLPRDKHSPSPFLAAATVVASTASSTSSACPSDVLPTLSLLSSLPRLASFALPFHSQLDLGKSSDSDRTIAQTHQSKSTTASTLPSSSHLLSMLPSLSPMPAGSPWGFTMTGKQESGHVAECDLPLTPPLSTKTLAPPFSTQSSLSSRSPSLSPLASSVPDLGSITEDEALAIVQEGLLHAKSLRA